MDPTKDSCGESRPPDDTPQRPLPVEESTGDTAEELEPAEEEMPEVPGRAQGPSALLPPAEDIKPSKTPSPETLSESSSEESPEVASPAKKLRSDCPDLESRPRSKSIMSPVSPTQGPAALSPMVSPQTSKSNEPMSRKSPATPTKGPAVPAHSPMVSPLTTKSYDPRPPNSPVSPRNMPASAPSPMMSPPANPAVGSSSRSSSNSRKSPATPKEPTPKKSPANGSATISFPMNTSPEISAVDRTPEKYPAKGSATAPSPMMSPPENPAGDSRSKISSNSRKSPATPQEPTPINSPTIGSATALSPMMSPPENPAGGSSSRSSSNSRKSPATAQEPTPINSPTIGSATALSLMMSPPVNPAGGSSSRSSSNSRKSPATPKEPTPKKSPAEGSATALSPMMSPHANSAEESNSRSNSRSRKSASPKKVPATTPSLMVSPQSASPAGGSGTKRKSRKSDSPQKVPTAAGSQFVSPQAAKPAGKVRARSGSRGSPSSPIKVPKTTPSPQSSEDANLPKPFSPREMFPNVPDLPALLPEVTLSPVNPPQQQTSSPSQESPQQRREENITLKELLAKPFKAEKGQRVDPFVARGLQEMLEEVAPGRPYPQEEGLGERLRRSASQEEIIKEAYCQEVLKPPCDPRGPPPEYPREFHPASSGGPDLPPPRYSRGPGPSHRPDDVPAVPPGFSCPGAALRYQPVAPVSDPQDVEMADVPLASAISCSLEEVEGRTQMNVRIPLRRTTAENVEGSPPPISQEALFEKRMHEFVEHEQVMHTFCDTLQQWSEGIERNEFFPEPPLPGPAPAPAPVPDPKTSKKKKKKKKNKKRDGSDASGSGAGESDASGSGAGTSSGSARRTSEEIDHLYFAELLRIAASAASDYGHKYGQRAMAATADATIDAAVARTAELTLDDRPATPDPSCYTQERARYEKLRGTHKLKLKDWTGAIEHFDRAIELDPASYVSLADRANAYIEIHDYPHAMVDLTRAIEMEPTYGRAYTLRGDSFVELGFYEQAAADYHMAMRVEPNNQEARTGLRYLLVDYPEFAFPPVIQMMDVEELAPEQRAELVEVGNSKKTAKKGKKQGKAGPSGVSTNVPTAGSSRGFSAGQGSQAQSGTSIAPQSDPGVFKVPLARPGPSGVSKKASKKKSQAPRPPVPEMDPNNNAGAPSSEVPRSLQPRAPTVRRRSLTRDTGVQVDVDENPSVIVRTNYTVTTPAFRLVDAGTQTEPAVPAEERPPQQEQPAMESSIKAILEAQNNAEELSVILNEMKEWEKEVKEKESKLNGDSPGQEAPPPRNRKKRVKPTPAPEPVKHPEKKKISAFDYAAWDRFNVDEACKEVDSAHSESESDGDEDFTPSELAMSKSRQKQETIRDTQKPPKKSDEITGTSPKPGPSVSPKLGKILDVSATSSQKSKTSANLDNLDAAHFEKELGNKFVREENWLDAIDCYTRAIEFDSTNAILHANRALCYLKLGNFKIAEVDSTVAIQLDKTYFKAYHRRAHARKGLQQYEEAIADFEKVLQLDPKNTAARAEAEKIREFLAKTAEKASLPKAEPTFDIKKVFGAEAKKSATKSSSAKDDVKKPSQSKTLTSEHNRPGVCISALPSESEPVIPVVKPPHLRSKEPLTRVEVKQVSDPPSFDRLVNALTKPKPAPEKSSPEPTRPPAAAAAAAPAMGLITRIPVVPVPETVPEVPRSYVQFENSWKSVRGHASFSYQYLKSIPFGSLRSIMGSSLESETLSELVQAMSRDECLQDPAFVYEFLHALADVQRFKSLVLFMSSQDQKALEKCLSSLKNVDDKDIQELRTLYDL